MTALPLPNFYIHESDEFMSYCISELLATSKQLRNVSRCQTPLRRYAQPYGLVR